MQSYLQLLDCDKQVNNTFIDIAIFFLSLYIGTTDYVAVSTLLTFTPSTSTQPICGTVIINSDDILEGEETFIVTLNSQDRAFNSLPVQAVVNIEDTTGIFNLYVIEIMLKFDVGLN